MKKEMFSSDLQFRDIFLDHFSFSVFICVLVVIITYFVFKKHNVQNFLDEKNIPVISFDQTTSDDFESDGTSDMSSPLVKKSPALAAEKVIQANMTEEQRKLEYEVRQKQLAQIHELMLKQSDKFGNISLSDVEEQMKLYQ